MAKDLEDGAPDEREEDAGNASGKSHAAVVASGILISRITGFLRERALGHFLGLSAHGDVFRAALRAPNVLQNLLGEGTLSASFIPIYSRFLAEGREEDAGRFAGAIFGLLLAATSAAVLLGMLLAEPLVALLTPGLIEDASKVATGELEVDRFPLTVRAVRFIFPMTGFLVLGVWALGILNSHRRFLLPYVAPVIWNAAIIAGLAAAGAGWLPPGLWGGAGTMEQILFAGCAGALVGGLLQFAIQLPAVARCLRGFRLSFSTRVEGVREALGAFGPVVVARGAVQLGSYLDMVLASLLATGAISALSPGTYVAMLPVSLFGLSVAAAELPELSRADAGALPAGFVGRVRRSLGQTAFLSVPSAVGYLLFGFPIVGALYRTGEFGLDDNWLVYLVLAGYSFGLVASTASRMLQNTFYALRETRLPARVAVLRVSLAALIGIPLMKVLDRISVAEVAHRWRGALGLPDVGTSELMIGAAGLALASSVGAWFELLALRRALTRRLGGSVLPGRRLLRSVGLALAAALPAALLWRFLPPLHPALTTASVVGCYAALYLGGARLLRLEELDSWLAGLRRRRR